MTAVLPATAQGEVDEVRTQIGENHVAYPQLKGMADEEIQTKINDDIVLSSGVANHLVTLATLGDSPWGLKVDYEVTMLTEDVFSAVMNAQGKMPDGREGQAYAALTYDLATGERLSMDKLFKDVDAAVAWMEAEAEESLGEGAQRLHGIQQHRPSAAGRLHPGRGRRHLLVSLRSASAHERVQRRVSVFLRRAFRLPPDRGGRAASAAEACWKRS